MTTTKMSAGATVQGLDATLKALNRIDKGAKDAVKDEVVKISKMLARELREAGNRTGDKRNRHVASSIRAGRDRTPFVKVGKADRMDVSRRGRGPRASDLMFGMEFGSTNTGSRGGDNPTRRGGRPGWRFPERTPKVGAGNRGYWLFPTLRTQQSRVVDLWADALQRVSHEWSKS